MPIRRRSCREWVDAIERAFDAYLADCAAALTCPFHSDGDPAGAFDALMAQVDAAPLEVSTEGGTRLVGQRAVLDAVDGGCRWSSRWPRLAAALAAAADGDGAPVLALADQRNERLPDGTYGVGITSFVAVGCLDFAITTDPAAYTALAAKAATHRPPPRRLLRDLDPALRLLAGAADDRPRTRPSPHGAPPILVVGATLDTQDAYSWSVDMAGQLESGVLLRREGTWHPSYLEQRLRRGCGQRLPARPDPAAPGA